MHGIHGLDAVRRGEFDHVVDRSVQGPSARQLPPRERLAQDLAFAVKGAPYAFWAQRENEPIKVCLDPTDEQIREGDAAYVGREWLESAKARSVPWVDEVQTSEDMQRHLEEFLEERKGARGRLVLGTYFGLLVEYWLRNCEALGVDNVKASIVVQDRATVLGSLKFAWSYEGQLMHLECSIKFFCWTGEHLVGPHLSESLLTRFRFAERKLAVGHAAGDSLREAMGNDSDILSIALIQGYVFYTLDEYLAANRDPKLPLNINKKVRENASAVAVHADHLLPDHEKRWFAYEFDEVCEALGFHGNEQEERWAVIPKLYWLSSLRLCESNSAERFGIPLLERESMRMIVRAHYVDQALLRKELEATKEKAMDEEEEEEDADESGRRQRRSLHSNPLNGSSPLMLAQLRYDNATGDWVETSRGFVLGPSWEAESFLETEALAEATPNDSNTLDLTECHKVVCRLEGAVPSKQANAKGRGKGKTAATKKGSPEACEHCKDVDLDSAIRSVVQDKNIEELLRALFLVDDSSGEVVQLKSNDHARHIMNELAERLADSDAVLFGASGIPTSNAADFALLVAMAAGHADAECGMKMQPREHKTFCRLALRASTLAASQRGDEMPSDRHIAQFCRFCIARGDMELLHLMLFSGRALQTGTLTLSGEASALVEEYIRSRLLEGRLGGEETGGESETGYLTAAEAAAAVGLLQAVQLRFSQADFSEMCARLVRMRHFDAAINLVSVTGAPEQTLSSLFRVMLTEGRTYKRAMALRRSFETLQFNFPQLDHGRLCDIMLKSDEEVPLMRDTLQWVSRPEDVRARNDLAVLFVNDAASLDKARDLFEAAREDAGQDKLIIGVDAEWGDLQLRKQDREALGGEHCDEDDAIAEDVPSYLALWQVCIDDKYALLLDLETLLADAGGELGQRTLALLLEIIDAEKVIMTGFSVHEDFHRMRAMLQPALSRTQTSGLSMNVVDSLTVASAFFPEKSRNLIGDPLSVSLDSWARLLLGVRLDKSYQCSEWSKRPLAEEQIQYAALDAVAPVRLVRAVLGSEAGPADFEQWSHIVKLW